MSNSKQSNIAENKQNNEDTIQKHIKCDNKINSINVKTTTENLENIVETASTLATDKNTESKPVKQEHSSNLNETNSESVSSTCSINIEILNENNTDDNSTNGNPQGNISNFEITTNNDTASDNATEENSLFTSDSKTQENVPHLNHRTSSNLNSDEEQGKLETLKDLATFLFFIIYLADIVTDISLACQFFYVGNIDGYFILFFVYASSLITTLIERKTRKRKNVSFVFVTVLISILNLAGVILYIEILKLLCKKLKKKRYDKNVLYLKQETIKILKVAEALHEALPQLIFQSIIISELIMTKENVTWLQYASVMTSGLGIIVSIGVYVGSRAQHIPNISAFGKVLRWLWQIFDAVFSFTVFITLVAIILGVLQISTKVYVILIFSITFLLIVFISIFKYNSVTEYERSMAIFLKICSTYDTFELKYLHPRKATTERILLISKAILLTIALYYTRNVIVWHLPFMYDLIHYTSIVCFFLGLLVIILIVVQIYRIPTVKSTNNIVSEFLSY